MIRLASAGNREIQIMKVFVTIIFILVSIALTAIVLTQEGKDAGLGTIGGIGDTYWSKNKSRSMEGNLVKLTKWLAAIFLILAVLLNMMPDKNKTSATPAAQTQTEVTVSSTESETVSGTEAVSAGTEKEAVSGQTEALSSAQNETQGRTEAGTSAETDR